MPYGDKDASGSARLSTPLQLAPIKIQIHGSSLQPFSPPHNHAPIAHLRAQHNPDDM
ncbi:hypothetical protein BKA80DRAFT_261655 [Phyllosticta citrichinensis]